MYSYVITVLAWKSVVLKYCQIQNSRVPSGKFTCNFTLVSLKMTFNPHKEKPDCVCPSVRCFVIIMFPYSPNMLHRRMSLAKSGMFIKYVMI